MYYENRKEKRGRGVLVFLAMLVIIGLLVAMNLRLEGMQNLSGNTYIADKMSNEEEPKEPKDKSDYSFIKAATKAVVGISKIKQTSKAILNQDSVINSGSRSNSNR